MRKACKIQYGLISIEARLAAVRELTAMRLPAGDPESMERESIPKPQDLLP